MATLYASFVDPADAEKATAALLDHGGQSEDITILAGEGFSRHIAPEAEALSAEVGAKTGISTTTGADAAFGAVKGSVIGLGVGTLAALAAIAIPGIGLVIGGGALATALAGALGTAAAGAAAGGVAGFLKDQGVGPDYVTHYSDALATGGSVVAVVVPSGRLSDVEAEQILAKYGATNVSLAGGETAIGDNPFVQPEPVIETVVVAPPIARTTLTTAPSTLSEIEIEPTIVDPVTGAMREGVAIDPLTGIERPVHTAHGGVVYADVPVSAFTVGDIVATTTDPVTGIVTAGYVIDRGIRRDVQVVNGAIIYADTPARTIVEETTVVQKPPVIDPAREF